MSEAPGTGGESPLGVLLVDDEQEVRDAIGRTLTLLGFDVTPVDGGEAALAALGEKVFDVVLTDLSMPGMDGMALFEAIRAAGRRVPVVVLTGLPSLETAIRAVELGAHRYLTKPFEVPVLVETLREAGTSYRARRQQTDRRPELRSVTAQVGLAPQFTRGLGQAWLARQPIVAAEAGAVAAWELLLRSDAEGMRSPAELLGAAEVLGQVQRLGREVRRLAAQIAATTPPAQLVFVNLHPEELADPELYSDAAPLARHAPRVVLEVTERSALREPGSLEEDAARLRALGYRLAVDDLGAGYSGLSSVAKLRPEFLKIDMALTRGADADPVRRKLIASIVALGRELDSAVVAEGIETPAEREVMDALGVDYLQGYLLGRPQRAEGPAPPLGG